MNASRCLRIISSVAAPSNVQRVASSCSCGFAKQNGIKGVIGRGIQRSIRKLTTQSEDESKRFVKDKVAEARAFRLPVIKCSTVSDKSINIGQPTPQCHPHLFANHDEVTPGITRKEYQLRRERLVGVIRASNVGKLHDRHLILLSAADAKTMSNDIPYPFHQDVDFLYLTGVQEPDAVLAIASNSSSEGSVEFILFMKQKDPKKELWDGAVIGTQAAVDYFAADEAHPLSSMEKVLTNRFGRGDYFIWHNLNETHAHRRHATVLKSLMTRNNNFEHKGLHSIQQSIQMMRLIKSNAEQRLMYRSAGVAAKAFTSVMKSCQSGVSESSLQALLEYQCKLEGADFPSFPPVVAGGHRANTLHYINNTQVLRDGDLVLIDGGCEYHGYPSDVTRTFPVNGKFTEPQKQLYEIVLRVQKACLERCEIGKTSLSGLHDFMIDTLAKELQSIEFLSSALTDDPVQLKKEVGRFCPHSLGHYLGMDTHDTPSVSRSLLLQPGMAFTLEPGLYVPKDAYDVPEKYRGIGIRIEDNVVMSDQGPFVLTHALPKTVQDIETIMQNNGNNVT